MGGVEQQAELHGVILAAAELQTTLIVGLDRIGAARADFRQHFGGGGQDRVRGPVLAADLRAIDPHRALGPKSNLSGALKPSLAKDRLSVSISSST